MPHLFAFNPRIRYVYIPPPIVTPSQAVVDDWKSRVTANGGTYTAGEANSLKTLLDAWFTQGLLELSITTGQVASTSVIQYVLPCCGSDLNAALTPLIYRSGSAVATNGSGVYNSTTKSFTTTSGTGVNTNFNPFSYGATTPRGFFLVRSNDISRTSAHGLYAASTSDRMQLHPSYAGTTYSDFGSRLSNAAVGNSTQKTFLRNSILSGTTALFIGGTQVGSGSTSASWNPPNDNLILGNQNEGFSEETQPVTFFAAGLNEIPSGQEANFIASIEAFRSALGGSAL